MGGAFAGRRSNQQIDVSFSCVCSVTDYGFHHNVAAD